MVLVTTPPHPASNARMMFASDSVGGAEDSRNGFSNRKPVNVTASVGAMVKPSEIDYSAGVGNPTAAESPRKLRLTRHNHRVSSFLSIGSGHSDLSLAPWGPSDGGSHENLAGAGVRGVNGAVDDARQYWAGD